MTWGTTGATMKLVAAGSPMSPLIVGFLRVAIAAPCLWLAARWLGGPIRIGSRDDWKRFLVAGVAMGVYQPFYFWGVAMTSVAVGSLIAICSAPLLITVLAALFLDERIDRRTWTALLVGITGSRPAHARAPRALEAPAGLPDRRGARARRRPLVRRSTRSP